MKTAIELIDKFIALYSEGYSGDSHFKEVVKSMEDAAEEFRIEICKEKEEEIAKNLISLKKYTHDSCGNFVQSSSDERFGNYEDVNKAVIKVFDKSTPAMAEPV